MLRVEGLIALLQNIDPKLIVWTEGCGCYAPAVGIAIEKDRITIVRSAEDEDHSYEEKK